jgi:hypothetical protein
MGTAYVTVNHGILLWATVYSLCASIRLLFETQALHAQYLAAVWTQLLFIFFMLVLALCLRPKY